MIGQTNSIVSDAVGFGGGGETVVAANCSGETLAFGDKVLLNCSAIETNNHCSATLTDDNAAFCPMAFLDDYDVLAGYSSKSLIYSYDVPSWRALEVTDDYGAGCGENCLYQYHNNGVIAASPLSSQDTGFISGSAGRVDLPSGYSYLGAYNNKHYCISGATSSIYEYDMVRNLVGAQALSQSVARANSFLFENKGLIVTASGTAVFFEIGSSDVFSVTETVTLDTSAPAVLYATGLNTGDLLFATGSYDGAYLDNDETSVPAPLVIYKIVSGPDLEKACWSEFKGFESKACLVSYDTRNKVLAIGTREGAYFYQFDDTEKALSTLPIYLNLPENTGGYCFWPFVSPTRKRVAVILKKASGDCLVLGYDLSGFKNMIVPNIREQYLPNNSVNAYALGENDGNGNENVRVLLPRKAKLTVTPDLTPDTVEFFGGVSL